MEKKMYDELSGILHDANKKAKIVDATAGSKTPDVKALGCLMAQSIKLYFALEENFRDFIKDKVSVLKGQKVIMHVETVFFEFMKAFAGLIDQLTPHYEKTIKGQFDLKQQNLIYTYVGNAYSAPMVAMIALHVFEADQIIPMFDSDIVQVITDKDVEPQPPQQPMQPKAEDGKVVN